MLREMKRETLHAPERPDVTRNTVTAYMQAELVITELFTSQWRTFGPVFTCPMMARLNAWITSGERGTEPIAVWAVPFWVH